MINSDTLRLGLAQKIYRDMLLHKDHRLLIEPDGYVHSIDSHQGRMNVAQVAAMAAQGIIDGYTELYVAPVLTSTDVDPTMVEGLDYD